MGFLLRRTCFLFLGDDSIQEGGDEMMKNQSLSALLVLIAIVGALVGCQATGAYASEFPSKEIQVIVGAAAGGLVDASARNLGKIMEESLGKPVVIVNKPGAASSLALAALKNAKQDGYTIGVNAGVPYTYNPHAQKVDYTLDDFSYIAAIAQFQWAYVSGPDKPWKDFKGLVTYAKTHPGMTYATMHPIGENILNYIAKKEGIEWRAIPTKGGAEVMTAVLGNHVDFGYSAGIHNVHVQAGQMIVLAGHGAARLLGSPDVPTLKELRYDVVCDDSIVVTTPKGIPDPATKKISEAVAKAARDPRYVDFLEKKLNVPAVYISGDVLLKSMREQSDFHRKMIEAMKQ
jgi:tripartite-type tricarboxylate transporter receptor subunit TctC